MEENIVNFDNNNCDNDDDDANDLLQVSTYVLYPGYTEGKRSSCPATGLIHWVGRALNYIAAV